MAFRSPMPSRRTATAASPEPRRRPDHAWPAPGPCRRQPRHPHPRSHHRENAEQLAQYARTPSLTLRNRLVTANLALVHHIARREARRCAVPLEDLLQEGSLGLIRAVEAFDAGRGAALSSYSIPYVRGRMRQHVRDRGCLLRGCRGLRDLHHRGLRLQQERLHRGVPPLDEAALAAALGCGTERWRAALGQARAQQLRSLDLAAPVGGHDAVGEGGASPIEALVDPRSLTDPYERIQAEETCRLVRRRLARLEEPQRQLLLARVVERHSWRELGRRLGISGRVAQRRCEALLEQLRQELEPLLAR